VSGSNWLVAQMHAYRPLFDVTISNYEIRMYEPVPVLETMSHEELETRHREINQFVSEKGTDPKYSKDEITWMARQRKLGRVFVFEEEVVAATVDGTEWLQLAHGGYILADHALPSESFQTFTVVDETAPGDKGARPYDESKLPDNDGPPEGEYDCKSELRAVDKVVLLGTCVSCGSDEVVGDWVYYEEIGGWLPLRLRRKVCGCPLPWYVPGAVCGVSLRWKPILKEQVYISPLFGQVAFVDSASAILTVLLAPHCLLLLLPILVNAGNAFLATPLFIAVFIACVAFEVKKLWVDMPNGRWWLLNNKKRAALGVLASFTAKYDTYTDTLFIVNAYNALGFHPIPIASSVIFALAVVSLFLYALVRNIRAVSDSHLEVGEICELAVLNDMVMLTAICGEMDDFEGKKYESKQADESAFIAKQVRNVKLFRTFVEDIPQICLQAAFIWKEGVCDNAISDAVLVQTATSLCLSLICTLHASYSAYTRSLVFQK